MSFQPSPPAPDLSDLVSLLQTRAKEAVAGQRGGFTFLSDHLPEGSASPRANGPSPSPIHWTFADLDQRARAIAADLQRLGPLAVGERALLLFPPGLDFLAGFFGCLYAGVVAVPASLPRNDRALPRLRGIIAAAQPRIVLTTTAHLADLERWSASMPELAGVDRWATDALDLAGAGSWSRPNLAPEALAFLQYTSGSTGQARGVMVGHRHLLANLAVIERSFGANRQSRGVSWLPLHHDMGLIGGALQVIYCGGTTTLFSPVSFLQRPSRWLELISQTGATISGGPNFAYDLCTRRVTAEQKVGLDLSHWSVAFNGAEPVRADTLDRFAAAFAESGFRREAFLPCYGLAEGTLIVSGGPPLQTPLLRALDPVALEQGVVAESTSATARSLVGSGSLAGGHQVAIVDPGTLLEQPVDRVGEIWVAGPSVADGYWNQPEATAATFQARLADSEGQNAAPAWLRTGDLGFVRDGQLVVTGRLKDLIIIRGRNLYPQDIEWTAGHAHPGLVANAWAAVRVEIGEAEKLVVVGEADRRTRSGTEAIAAIRAAVAAEFDVDLHAVVLLRPMTLPRTSSGKVRRAAIRDEFLAGTLTGVVASWTAEPTLVVEPTPAAEPAAPASQTDRSAAAIAAWLVGRLATELGVAPAAIDPTRPFQHFGLGSLRAVELAGAVETWLGRPLAPTLLYDYPTIHSLAAYLAGDPGPTAQGEPAAAPMAAQDQGEAVAILGIGCRFPGAAGPAAFWDLLASGTDAVGPVPPERQVDFPAPAETRAGFLPRVDGFDAAFFGIAPREATWIDPQHRLLLEVAWEALEDAGQVVDRLAGEPVGVFVGISTHDYARLADRVVPGADGPGEAYALTGNAGSIAANRLSYTFDWRGPSLAIDTACSSSLVAIDAACRSLRSGESTLAVAGGVNLILEPDLLADFRSAGFLAPDGRCKTFDASADGYVRGEGAGLVVLKPLAAALRDGDPVRAVIRGGAVNQDGRSNGLTAPNGRAQEAVLHAAYRAAGVEPAAVGYVEAHGTGTLLGDPIEARALGTVLSGGRPAAGQRCWVGSAKTNIGHLEAAAGVAGVIKVALALEQGLIPPSLHYQNPNPHIPLASLPIAVAAAATAWDQPPGDRRAGVSSFGFGGTNAHLVLAGVEPTRAERVVAPSYLLPLSARSPEALRASAGALRDRLAAGDLALADVAATLGTRRSHLQQRLTVVADSLETAVSRLDAASRGEVGPGLASGQAAPGSNPQVVFVFSGQGGQWLGMGRDLLDLPVFAKTVAMVDRLIQEQAGWSVQAILARDVANPRDLDPEFAQPTLFALHLGLAALWESWGVEPAAVVGHSLGEVAAAYHAGVLTLADAVRLIVARGRLVQRVIGLGRTVAVGLSGPEAHALAEAAGGRLAVAAINGPTATTLSGDPDSILEQVDEWTAEGTFARLLPVDVAYHGPQMDPLAAALVDLLADLQPGPARVPLVSTVTGQWIDGSTLNAAYWGRNLRDPVQFQTATEALVAEGLTTFVEIGPHPSLVASIAATARLAGQDACLAVGSLRRDGVGLAHLHGALGALHTRGVAIRWASVNPPAPFVRLPTYPWQRERFWLPQPASTPLATDQPTVSSAPECPPTPTALPAEFLYEVTWEPVARPSRPAPALAGRWVVLDDRGGRGRAFRAVLAERGIQSVAVSGEGVTLGDAGSEAAPALARILGEVAAGGDEPIAGIVSFWGLDAPVLDPATTDSADLAVGLSLGVGRAVALAQAVAHPEAPVTGRLWLVTSGAHAVPGDDEGAVRPEQAALWALGRSLRWDRLDAWGGLVDLDPQDPLASLPGLADALLDPHGDDEQAVRATGRRAARLNRAAPPAQADAEPVRVRPDSTYVVTGGLGDLGLRSAGWLVEQGARRLILIGRRGLPARGEWAGLPADDPAQPALSAIQRWEALGATVVVAAADVADEPRLRAVMVRAGELLPPIRGVIHAAGLAGSGLLRDLTAADLARVLRPKVQGAWALHRVTRDLPLDFLVSYSSVASVLGGKDPLYAAANGFLDGLATTLGAQGRPALSLGWGPVAGSGLATHLARSHKLLGLEPIDPAQALAALGMVLAGPAETRRHLVVADVDWFTLGVVQGRSRARRFAASLIDAADAAREVQPRVGQPDSAAALPVDLWRTFPLPERREEVIRYFRDRVANVLRLDPSRVDPERRLDALGLDSIMAIELKSGVEADLGTNLPISRLLDGPTIRQLADQAIEQWHQSPDRQPTGPERTAPEGGEAEDVSSPLSVGQRSLWLIHQRLPDDAAYNMAGAARVRGDLDIAALQRTLQGLVDRHAMLRATFAIGSDGEPVQKIAPSGTPLGGFRVVDAAGWDDRRLADAIAAEARRPFRLAEAPPFRTTLFRRAADDHRLVLSAHHIVGDFWSIALLMDELGTRYAAERLGKALPPGEPALRYTDFARWQSALLAGPEGDRLRNYWGDVLAGPLPTLDLAPDRPRPAVRTQRGGTRGLLLDADLTAHLSQLGASSGASLYVTLLAAFQALLGRLTGQDDIIVGSPVAGRDRARTTDVVGYFANPLPIRTRLGGDPSFVDLVAQVRRTVFAGLEHQDLPFAAMAEAFATSAGVSRDPSRSPIFQAMFVFQKAQKLDEAGLTPFVLRGEGSTLQLGDFALESLAIDLGASQFELTLAAAETDHGLATTLEYNADLFDGGTAERILQRFATLLRSAVAHPHWPISRLAILPPEEWDAVVVAPNQTAQPIPDHSVVRAIEAQAAAKPDAVAVAFQAERLTYAALNAQSNRLARHLRSLGVGPESRVGLCVERSAAMVVGILAILKAGGAYVPLDPTYPRERLAFLLDDAEVRVLVTQEAVRDRLPAHSAVVVPVDADADRSASLDPGNPEGEAGPDDPAYLIYTSGSTGRPKGVVVTHRNLAHSTHARALHYREPVGAFLLLASFAHDTSVAGLFWTLTQGGCLVIPAQGWHADPNHLTTLTAEHAITHWNCVPSLLRVILHEAPAERLASLRVIFLGGEVCPRDLPDLVHARLPQVELHNEYGPTEASVWCTVHVCQPGAADESVPIGRPIPNATIYVVDGQGNPAPVGTAGELLIGGAGVTRGYFRRPSLTAERFVADPFGPPGARLYRTGDLARWRADGALDFLGRMDHQVKVRGYRIELGEVEAALIGHPRLAEVVAVAREDVPGDSRLVAYFLPRRDPAETQTPVPTPGELRRWLRDRLPDPLIPTVFVAVDTLPLSPNGKVDRSALPAPSLTDHADRRTEPMVAPRTEAEVILERLAATVLGRSHLSVLDDFFDLGIDSIRAIQLVSRARAAGLGLEPVQVFEHPTVAGLAQVAVPVLPPTPAVASLAEAETPRSADPVEATYPLAPMQAAMLTGSASQPGAGVYVQQFAAPIRHALAIPAFEAAWQAVIARHAALRTAFAPAGATPERQEVRRRVPLPLDHRDWSDLPESAFAERLDTLLADDRARGFDPAVAPLLRLALIRRAPDHFHLVVSNHHALMDGWCAPILLGEVLAAYEALAAGQPVDLPPTRPYRDYIAALELNDAAADSTFWRNELRGFRQPTPLPVALRSPSANRAQSGRTSAESERTALVSADLLADLHQFARRHRLTLGTILTGAWALVLGRHAGRDDVVFGLTVSGRPADLPGVEGMIGLFINTLPARVSLPPDASLVSWLADLQGRLLALRSHQTLPLAEIRRQADLAPGRPLFESILVVENTPDNRAARERASRLGVGPLRVFERTEFPLVLTAVPAADTWTITARFDGGRIQGASVGTVLDHLVHLLGAMAAQPESALADLALGASPVPLTQGAGVSPDPFALTAPLPHPGTGDDASPLDRLDALSDEEVDALLATLAGNGGATHR